MATEDIINEIGALGAENDNTGEEILREADAATAQAAQQPDEHGKTGMLGTRIATQAERLKGMHENFDSKTAGVTRVGQTLEQTAEIRDGWIPVDRALLGERDVFYPEGWEFLVRPATVEAIKNWSTIDENDPRSVDTVFNEILKSCLAIRDGEGRPVVWSQINSWDRFFFILLIRDYTFINGQATLEFEEECPECDNPVTFNLKTGSLYYDMPDPEVMPYWNREERVWEIDTEEFGLENRGVLRLYVPTLEKDQNLLQYITDQYQQKGKVSREFEIFLKYLVWLLPRAPKDQTLLKRKVREAEMDFKGWDIDEFQFIDEVVRNIQITPSQKLVTTCPVCGEEVTATIRFQHGIKSIFAVQSRLKKFGSK